MISEAEKARDARSKKTWVRAIIALSVVFVLGITGVVYYGAVALPAINKAKDVTACKTFLVGYDKAKLAFLNEENAKDHKPSVETAVKAYAQELSTSYNKAFSEIGDVNGTVGQAMKNIAMNRLNLDTTNPTNMASSFANLDNSAGTAEQICSGALAAANVTGKFGAYTPAPSASPSK
jgi:hypothetical protein